ncbi:MAG TPA: hypothetical protein VMS17_25480 [Gemmataceae bacterium]|nr:hypothetical protein [Gemmataceae bacterium]
MKLRLFVGVTALAVAVLAGGWLMGDDKKPDDPPATKLTGHLPPHYKKLGLSDKQIQDIYKVQASYKDKIDALQQQLDDLKKAEHTDVENILTADQKTALKALQTGDPTDPTPPPTPPAKDKPATPPPPAPPDTSKPPPPPAKDKPAPPTTDK